MLGLGERAVRAIPTDEGFRMRVDDARGGRSRTTWRRDCTRSRSSPPPASTATGAIDPLPAVADLCADRTACGCTSMRPTAAAAVLAPELRPLLAGTERADSIAFDPHKWLYTPQSSACLLVRDPARLLRSFSIDAAYVRDDASLSGRG